MKHVFPSNFICWYKVKDHDIIKQKYYSEILKREFELSSNHWIADVKTSHNNDELNALFYSQHFCSSVIWTYFDNMLVEMKDTLNVPERSYLSYCWYNLYDAGSFQEPHQHDNNYFYADDKIHSNSFCGIYFLHMEEENKTVFEQQPPIPGSTTNSGYLIHTKFLQEGDVVFFPSGLSHYVLPCESRRCTISFNITSVYQKNQSGFL